MIQKHSLQTSNRDELIDITEAVKQFVREAEIDRGLVVVYCPHTTAGITVNENADPDVRHDMLLRLDEVYPWDHPQYKHAEGNSASHLKASTVGTEQTLIVENGQLLLGTWQGVYFCEFDGPRKRSVFFKGMKEN